MQSGCALLLIADMGGYTDYMSAHRMSLGHAEATTARLLDRVIDAAPEFDLYMLRLRRGAASGTDH